MEEKKFLIKLKTDYFQLKKVDKIPTRQPTPAIEPDVVTEPVTERK